MLGVREQSVTLHVLCYAVLCCAVLCSGAPVCFWQRRRNATRLCEYIVSAQCLQRKLPEDCIAELMANSTMHTADGAAASDARTVAIAVPVAVGGERMQTYQRKRLWCTWCNETAGCVHKLGCSWHATSTFSGAPSCRVVCTACTCISCVPSMQPLDSGTSL